MTHLRESSSDLRRAPCDAELWGDSTGHPCAYCFDRPQHHTGDLSTLSLLCNRAPSGRTVGGKVSDTPGQAVARSRAGLRVAPPCHALETPMEGRCRICRYGGGTCVIGFRKTHDRRDPQCRLHGDTTKANVPPERLRSRSLQGGGTPATQSPTPRGEPPGAGNSRKRDTTRPPRGDAT